MSKIKLIKNRDIPLNIPSFSCDDNVVGEHMNDHPLTQLLNCYGFTCFVGKPGQGKTSLSIALMTQKKPRIYRKTHHCMLIMMPTNSINSMKNNPFKVLPPENFYNELNDETITSVYNRIVDNRRNNKKTILYIDDCTADLKHSRYVEHKLKEIVYNRRHNMCNIIITSQSYVNLPLDIRKTLTSVFMFKPSKKEMELLFSELIESSKDKFMDIMRFAFNKSHNFLFVNITTQRMFCNWDEIILSNDDEENPEK